MTDTGDDAQRIAQVYMDAALSQVRRPSVSGPAVSAAAPAGPRTCIDCGDAVPAARIAAMPDTGRCVKCQVLRDARSL